MLVYGHRAFRLNLRKSLDSSLAQLAALSAAPDHDTLVSLLIDISETACAYADALSPDCDDERGEMQPWSRATEAAASAVVASWDGRSSAVPAFLAASAASLRDAARSTPSLEIDARICEGFAIYGLFPEQYIEAAYRLADEAAPRTALCLGLRSIGFALAHIAGAALASRGIRAEIRTVRPRGHPFDRRLVLGAALSQRIATLGHELVAIMDEGPGLSGSSFAAAVEAVAGIGIPRARIVLLPGWNAAAQALRSDRAKRAWTEHRRISISFEQTWRGRAPLDEPAMDVSAGAWRDTVFPRERVESKTSASARWPAVHPQHERRKYLRGSGADRMLWKFAGLGRYGRAAFARSERLASAGFSAPPDRLIHGFVAREWIDGRPLTCASWSPAIAAHLSEYLAFLSRAYSTARMDDVEELCAMLEVNVSESLGPEWSARIHRLAESARPFGTARVQIDGRMLPHEWITHDDRVLKVDETDHHADDFFPGDRDIAWDVAGAIEEFNLPAETARAFVSEYRERSHDASIAARLPFYRAAYLAYRIGYATLAADSLDGTPDAARFSGLARRYRRSLVERLRQTR